MDYEQRQAAYMQKQLGRRVRTISNGPGTVTNVVGDDVIISPDDGSESQRWPLHYVAPSTSIELPRFLDE